MTSRLRKLVEEIEFAESEGLEHIQPFKIDIEKIPDEEPVEDWEQPALNLDGVQEQLMKKSLAYFASEMLQGPPGPPYHGRFLISEHHEEWSQFVQENERVCVLASRDLGKSWLFSLAYPLWQAWQNPNQSGFIFSATQDQATRILDSIKDEIESNPKLQFLMPKTKGNKLQWSKTKIRLANGHTIYARGFGTRVRGAHPQWVVADDVLNDDTAWSETTRRKQNDYFFSAVTGLPTPGGQIIVVGCVGLDTWVQTDRGLRQMRDLGPEEKKPQTIHPYEGRVVGRDGQLQRASQYWVNGEGPTKRVTLQRGYNLECSLIHPVWVMGEDGVPTWKKASALQKGDYVAVRPGTGLHGDPVDLRPFKDQIKQVTKARNEINLPDFLNQELAELIGLWTAEGSLDRGRVAITTSEPELRTYLQAQPFGLKFSPSSTSEWTLRANSQTFVELIEFLGGHLGRAPTKVFPRKIMEGNSEGAIGFLRGFFSGDGCASGTGAKATVSAATTSEALARDIHQVLLHLGIVSSLRSFQPQPSELVQNPTHPIFSVEMRGGWESVFLDKVGFRLQRKQGAIEGRRKVNPFLPHQGARILELTEAKPRGRRSPPPGNIYESIQKPTLRSSTLRKLRDWFADHQVVDPVLDENLDSGLIWSPVEQIEDSHGFTVDFVIPEDHTFISNGIVSHNTPFCTQDLYWHLERNVEYVFGKYPAICKDGTAQWPERYPLERLKAIRREVGPIRFARERMCETTSDEMSLFPMYLFEGTPVEQYQLTLGMPRSFWEEVGVDIYMGVDFAISSNVKADYTVIMVLGVDKNGNRWVIDFIREQGLAYETQKSLIVKLARRYQPGLIYLESNQMQRIWGDQLIRETDLPIYKFITTGSEKHGLERGLPSLRVLFENKKLRLPRGDTESVEKTEDFKREFSGFTYENGRVKSTAEHDDIPMAFFVCNQAILKGSPDLGTADLAGEVEESDKHPFDYGDIQDPEEKSEFDPDLLNSLVSDQNLSDGMKKQLQSMPEGPSIGFGDEVIDENENDVFTGESPKKQRFWSLPMGVKQGWVH